LERSGFAHGDVVRRSISPRTQRSRCFFEFFCFLDSVMGSARRLARSFRRLAENIRAVKRCTIRARLSHDGNRSAGRRPERPRRSRSPFLMNRPHPNPLPRGEGWGEGNGRARIRKTEMIFGKCFRATAQSDFRITWTGSACCASQRRAPARGSVTRSIRPRRDCWQSPW